MPYNFNYGNWSNVSKSNSLESKKIFIIRLNTNIINIDVDI